MSFFAVLLALLIEQLKPLPRDNRVHESVVGWVGFIGRNFDAGALRHAWAVWCLAVLLPGVVAGALFIAIRQFGWVPALVLDVLVLYMTLGFRQFSHYFTDIREALDRGDENEARRLLAEWRHLDTEELPRTEVLRHVVEHALLAAHRHVFGVFFWFVAFSALGLGPAGAVLYRMAEFASRYWSDRQRAPDSPVNPHLSALARRAFAWADHLPARLTAAGFAVVGNFEDAVAGWRRDSTLWQDENEGIILAAAAGAVGMQLGGAAPPGVTPDRRKTFTADGEPLLSEATGSTGGLPLQGAHLHAVVGLVWRSVVLWMLLVAMLSMANVLG